jgi:hypothetical protein
VRISLAWVGVDMTENSGGALIDDLEVSAFNAGVLIDDSLDSVRLNNVHSWIFDLTPNQQMAFFDPGAVTFDIGRCDDCKIIGGLSMAGTAMHFFQGSAGPAFGSVSDFAFDTNNGIDMSAGTIDMSNVYFTLNPNAPVQAIHMTGGTLNVSSFWALAGPTTVPMVSVLNVDKNNTTSLNMSNGKVTLGRQDAAFLTTRNMGGARSHRTKQHLHGRNTKCAPCKSGHFSGRQLSSAGHRKSNKRQRNRSWNVYARTS